MGPGKKTLLAMGGSQGAKTINDAMMGAAFKLVNENNIQVIHQTGKKNFDEYIEKLNEIWPDFENSKSYIVRPYFDDMSYPLAASDIAISRAGSLSISELNLSELPSILIPYPYAASDHQRYNAIAMQDHGASIYLDDKKCTSEMVIKLVIETLESEKLEKMRKANKTLSKPNATDNIITVIKNSVRK